jgi:hypothetical protein
VYERSIANFPEALPISDPCTPLFTAAWTTLPSYLSCLGCTKLPLTASFAQLHNLTDYIEIRGIESRLKMPTVKARHPVQYAPAPWSLKCESYWLLLNLKTLPKGIYDPLEEPLLEHGEFKGGLGCIIVVRYKDTPVGMFSPTRALISSATSLRPLPWSSKLTDACRNIR